MTNKYLKYRIYSLSSELEPGMGFKLMNDESHWESARSCDYPQEITLQFLLPMMTSSMKIVFHQYKIPNLVEIFIKAMPRQKYRRLGYIKPSSNEHTGFEEQQIRTIYFQFPCSFIKIVLHKNHANQYNIFNQVAIEELAVEGELMSADLYKNYTYQEVENGSSEEEEQPSSVTNQDSRKTIQEYTEPREQFKTVYAQLERRKQQAVDNEDFQEASILKSSLNRFRQMQLKTIELQKEKKQALEVEDFEKCKIIKSQMTALKNNLDNEIARLFQNQPQQNNNSHSVNHSNYQTQQRSNHYVDHKITTAIPMKNSEYNIFNTAEKPNVNTLLSPSSYENQIIPAVLKKALKTSGDNTLINNTQLEEFPAQENEHLTERLHKLKDNPELVIPSKYQQYFPYVKDYMWKAILQKKDWKLKQEMFNELMQMDITSKEKMFACFELCALTINDKHPNIIIHTLLLINRIIKSNLNIAAMQHPPLFITEILTSMIHLMNETNPRIHELAITTYQIIPQLSLIYPHFSINLLIGKKNSRIKLSPKHTHTKITVMMRIIEKYSFSEDIYIDILEWAIGYLEDSNQEVRSGAIELIIKGLLPQLGEQAIRSSVKNIRPNILGSFNILLNQSISIEKRNDTVVKSQMKTEQAEQQQQFSYSQELTQSQVSRQTLNQHISEKDIRVLQLDPSQDEQYEQDKKPSTTQEIQIYEQPNQDLEICDYCGYQNPDLSNEQNFNQHVMKECKVLTTCENCSQRIYIRDLTQHFLKQCIERYQQCKKCKLAFPMQDISHHIASGLCKVTPKIWQKCQLCTQLVARNDEAWRAHSDKCTK